MSALNPVHLQLWILPRFTSILLRFTSILPRFTSILPRFTSILPRFTSILRLLSINPALASRLSLPFVPISFFLTPIPFQLPPSLSHFTLLSLFLLSPTLSSIPIPFSLSSLPPQFPLLHSCLFCLFPYPFLTTGLS